MIKVNDFVVFENPMPDEIWESGDPLRFQVKEINGDSVLLEAVTPALHIRPLLRAKIQDLQKVDNEIA